MSRRMLVGMVAVGALILAGCGGGATDTTTGAPAGSSDSSAPSTTAAGSATTTMAPTTTASAGTGEGAVATVTIGDTTYEFADDGGTWSCGSLGDTMYGTWATDANGTPMLAGGSGVEYTLIFTVGPTDWETSGAPEPSVAVQVASEGAQWWAGAVPQVSKDSHLDSWTAEGSHAQGDATFIDVGAYNRDGTDTLVPGTFDISCP